MDMIREPALSVWCPCHGIPVASDRCVDACLAALMDELAGEPMTIALHRVLHTLKSAVPQQ